MSFQCNWYAEAELSIDHSYVRVECRTLNLQSLHRALNQLVARGPLEDSGGLGWVLEDHAHRCTVFISGRKERSVLSSMNFKCAKHARQQLRKLSVRLARRYEWDFNGLYSILTCIWTGEKGWLYRVVDGRQSVAGKLKETGQKLITAHSSTMLTHTLLGGWVEHWAEWRPSHRQPTTTKSTKSPKKVCREICETHCIYRMHVAVGYNNSTGSQSGEFWPTSEVVQSWFGHWTEDIRRWPTINGRPGLGRNSLRWRAEIPMCFNCNNWNIS